MYKVMLVDDEPIIVEGLSRSIPWEKWNCEVVATANDGLEGKERIEQYKPNILFMDICMPEMDGLTLIAAIKSEYPDTEVCILTGFRDFEYAQKAIRLGVTRFLLKPSNMDELEEAISAMCENLKKKSITGEESAATGEAAEKAARETAKSLLALGKLSYEEISKVSKLSVEEIKELDNNQPA